MAYKFAPGDLVDYNMWPGGGQPREWWEWTLLWNKQGVVVEIEEVRSRLRRNHSGIRTDAIYCVRFEDGRESLCREENMRFALNPHTD